MFLAKERATLEKFFPGLDEALLKISLMERENQDNSSSQANPTIKLFGQFGGPRLLIPAKYGGMQVTPFHAIQIQRALGSRSPSLAVAATMHHFTVAIIDEMTPDKSDFDLFEHVAKNNLFFSSGFAEGRAGVSIFDSHMQVKPISNGLIISGSKKPCTLSMSMDLMTASVILSTEDGPDEIALVVIPANSPGIERRPFWKSLALTGTESHEVILNEVYVAEEHIFKMGSPSKFDKVVARSFIWFELLACAAYLGVSSSLVERCFIANRGIPSERVALATELEGAMSALQGLAFSITDDDENRDDLVAQAIFVRHFVEGVIERVAMGATELLGGMAFVQSPEVTYLLASARALAFHGPSRLSAASGLDKYLFGEPLQIS